MYQRLIEILFAMKPWQQRFFWGSIIVCWITSIIVAIYYNSTPLTIANILLPPLGIFEGFIEIAAAIMFAIFFIVVFICMIAFYLIVWIGVWPNPITNHYDNGTVSCFFINLPCRPFNF